MKRPLVLAALCVASVIGVTGLASASGFVTLSPADGPRGSTYTVSVDCADEPTLYGRPLVDQGPPGTLVPLAPKEVAPGTWQVEATAGDVDDLYGATCDEATSQARFDVDAPRLHLGPIPETPFQQGARTTVEGTDCPAGTTASVAIHRATGVVEHTAAIDERGDWAVDLPGPAGTEALSIDASCGSVTYEPLQVAAVDGGAPVVPGPPVTAPPPAPAAPVAATPSFTG